jgi:lipid A 3-O-deacylase|tara:strand:+ start:933 stop:1451 length:519 start_codon:yes stop_codon:yes gene_type:complete
MYFKKLSLLFVLTLLFTPSQSETSKISELENKYSFYVGTFDTIDKEGDDKTSLFGLEHNNTNLSRDTFLGKFSPITGGFISGKSSVYLYTGVQAEYSLGPVNILPSFAPGYYEAGDGKNLGSVLEFKSEIKFDINIFKNSKIGYSYNHISNNDWGKINPGINNQQISISRNF